MTFLVIHIQIDFSKHQTRPFTRPDINRGSFRYISQQQDVPFLTYQFHFHK